MNWKFWQKPKTEFEIRAESVESTLTSAFLGADAMSRELALQIPSVAGAVDKIGSEIAKLPVRLYRKDENGEVAEVKNDRRTFLLNVDTGDTLSTVDFWKALTADYFLGKGGFAYIDKANGDVRSIRYVDSAEISILKNRDAIFKDYSIRVGGVKFFPFEFIKVLRKTTDGASSVSLCSENSAILSVAYNSLIFENNLVKKGGNKRGFFKAKARLSEAAVTQLRNDVSNLYNSDSAEKFVILNDGMDFQETSASSTELQLNENKRTNGDEIFKLFGFPKSVLVGGATDTDKEMFVNAVVSVLNAIEAALDKDLLKESEKGSFYFAFDTKELTRGNIKERFDAYGVALDKSFMQLDEVRKDLDLPPLGFDFIKLNLADVFYNTKTKEFFVANTQTTESVENFGGEKDEN